MYCVSLFHACSNQYTLPLTQPWNEIAKNQLQIRIKFISHEKNVKLKTRDISLYFYKIDLVRRKMHFKMAFSWPRALYQLNIMFSSSFIIIINPKFVNTWLAIFFRLQILNNICYALFASFTFRYYCFPRDYYDFNYIYITCICI